MNTSCPWCGAACIGVLQKLLLGPARAMVCRQCGRKFSHRWLDIIWCFPLVAAGPLLILLDLSNVERAIVVGAAAAGSAVLHLLFAQLERR